mmetsp:Transcript_9387/g.12785  ORF Transcript_9387/g.12785 Transcript_9387/m.12785 type:complete len:102 (+) Transcript_9387:798-1103(+)
MGVLEDDEITTIRFMNNECSLALHYLYDESFRLTITSLEGEHIQTISINVELEFEQAIFDQQFEFYEHEEFKTSGNPVPLKERETMLRSLKIVPKAFIEKI